MFNDEFILHVGFDENLKKKIYSVTKVNDKSQEIHYFYSFKLFNEYIRSYIYKYFKEL